MKKLLLLLCLLPSFAGAQSLWSAFSVGDDAGRERLIHPQKAALKRLDFASLRNRLEAAPDWLSAAQLVDNEGVTIELPMPDGSFARVEAFRADVLHPDLAKQFPSIRSYFGRAEKGDPRVVSARFDATDAGFHGLVFLKDGQTVFIDPLWRGETAFYQSYFKSDFVKKGSKHGPAAAFECHTGDAHPAFGLPKAADLEEAESNLQGDCGKLRRYRLALSCTGEYAAFHGGTVAGAMAAMTTSMTRINGVYEKDLSVTMQIVANNNLITFTNAATDPFDNSDIGQCIDQNQITCDAVIGAANYDIGHVFSTAGGGLACLFCPCTSGKATAGTGLGSPVGDPFDIDYVAHEIGHQFGGRHTQNNNCNRDGLASMEPGSGSTIMGYAGICAPNVSSNSDAYFHAINLQHMALNIVSGSGSTCPTVITVANSAPVASPVLDRTVPVSTPFYLETSASDPDGDALTFCWEQMDPQPGAMPPQPTNTVGPMFQSLPPVASPTRYMPRPPVLAGIATSVWETLPSVPRTMKFRVTVRDNHMGGGCTDESDMTVTTAGTAPFAVTNPNASGIIWTIGNTETVTWNVAGTTGSPFFVADVNILLSTDGGLTFPTKLAVAVPNDGSHPVLVPDFPSTTCRVKVEAVGNIFFDISDKNFEIKAPVTPTFLLEINPQKLTVCAGVNPVYTISAKGISGFVGQIQLAATLPQGMTGVFAQNPIPAGGSTTLTLFGTPNQTMPGSNQITVTGTSGAITQTLIAGLEVLPGAPLAAPTGLAPANGTANFSNQGPLTWAADATASSYLIELAASPSFSAGSILLSQEVFSNAFNGPFAGGTVFYWRVRSKNTCGLSPWSGFSSFQTFGVSCSTTASTDVPKQIDTPGPAIVNSMLTIPAAAGVTILDADVVFKANHTWVGDIEADLVPPVGGPIKLFDRPGSDDTPNSFGCEGDNISVTLDDEATMTATELEGMCNGAVPTISGFFKPILPLSQLDGQNSAGVWVMRVQDNYPTEDFGQLIEWSLKICASQPISPAALLVNQPLQVAKGAGGVISQSLLAATAAANPRFTVTSLPSFGTLFINGAAATVGATFTQNDINNGLVTYLHGGAAQPATDSFGFDLLFQNGGNWLPGQLFQIQVIQNTLAATLQITQQIACNGGTGQITAQSSGGTPAITFSLNGGPFQSSGVFSNLSAGTFTVVAKDGNGFTATAGTVILAQPAVLTVSASVSTSSITATAAGGSGQKTYSLNGGPFSAQNTWTNLPNGQYTITAKDANGCTAQTTATILVNTLAVSAQATGQILCNGGATGQVTVGVNGGQPSFLYSLNGGPQQSSNVFSSLAAGSFSVVVTDGQGFSATTNTVVLSNPPLLQVAATASGSTVSATATGGTGSKSYSLNGGAFSAQNSWTNLANGAYTIVAQDANGCTASTQVIVAVNTLVVGAQIVQTVLCSGGATGQLSVSVGGGQGPYSYALNGGAGQPSNLFTNLAAGGYSVVVTDGQGFSATTNSVTLGNPPLLTISLSVNGSTITANGGGGTPGLVYGLGGQNFSANNVFPNLPNGQYTITVRDANGCLASATATVLVNTLAVTANATGQIPCFGNAAGQITVGVNGGQPSFLYSINGGPQQPSNLFTNLLAGSYSVVVTDGQGFSATTNTVVLSNPPLLTASASANLLTITAAAMGGTGALAYSIDGQNFQASPIFQVSQNGTYTITVRDQNNCGAWTTVVVNVPPLGATSTVSSQILCFGDQNGEITATASGGIPPYQYSLNGIAYQPSPVFQNLGAGLYTIYIKDATGAVATHSQPLGNPPPVTINVVVTGNDVQIVTSGGAGGWLFSIDGQNYFNNFGFFNDLPNGSYTGWVKDFAGCIKSKDFVINVQPPSMQLFVQNAPCFGQTGSIEIAASGTNPPFQYSLDGQIWTSNNQFMNLAAGNYVVWVRDNSGQTTTQNATITAPPEIIVTATVNVSTITATATGGAGTFNYSLDGGPAQASNVFLNVPTGTHTVAVNDQTGCTASATVNVGSNTIAVVAENFVSVSCFGATDGGFDICITGAVPPFSVSVTPNVGVLTQIQGLCAGNWRLSGVPAGNFQIVVTDAANFSKTLSIGLTQPPIIAVGVNVVGDDAFIDATGGTGSFTYSLDGQSFQPSNLFADLPNGSYTVTAKDANGCTATKVFLVQTISSDEPGAAKWTFSIQPNPTDGKAQLIDNQQVTSVFSIKIFDAAGRLIRSEKASLPLEMDFSNLPSGVFQVLVADGQRAAVARLVKI